MKTILWTSLRVVNLVFWRKSVICHKRWRVLSFQQTTRANSRPRILLTTSQVTPKITAASSETQFAKSESTELKCKQPRLQGLAKWSKSKLVYGVHICWGDHQGYLEGKERLQRFLQASLLRQPGGIASFPVSRVRSLPWFIVCPDPIGCSHSRNLSSGYVWGTYLLG